MLLQIYLLNSQKDNKADQKGNFRALQNYGMYGPYNSTRNNFERTAAEEYGPTKTIERT